MRREGYDVGIGAAGGVRVVADEQLAPRAAGRFDVFPRQIGDVEINPVVGVVGRERANVGVGQRFTRVIFVRRLVIGGSEDRGEGVVVFQRRVGLKARFFEGDDDERGVGGVVGIDPVVELRDAPLGDVEYEIRDAYCPPRFNDCASVTYSRRALISSSGIPCLCLKTKPSPSMIPAA